MKTSDSNLSQLFRTNFLLIVTTTLFAISIVSCDLNSSEESVLEEGDLPTEIGDAPESSESKTKTIDVAGTKYCDLTADLDKSAKDATDQKDILGKPSYCVQFKMDTLVVSTDGKDLIETEYKLDGMKVLAKRASSWKPVYTLKENTLETQAGVVLTRI